MNHFDNNIAPYLEGKAFSNSYNVDLGKSEMQPRLNMRLDYLEEMVRGKSVLHLGFADHLPLIKTKIEKNNWLHKRLVDSASACWGIDIDRDVVDFVKNEIGINQVCRLDIVSDEVPDIFRSSQWDYMIIGEVLEHIDNPVHFLSVIANKYAGIVKQIVVTVPNAFDLVNIRNILKNIECINTDHRYWFTPYTLAKVGTRAGLKIQGFLYCQSYMPNGIFSKMLVKKFGMLRESVVMVFDVKAKG